MKVNIFPKDKTSRTDAGNRTLDPHIQSPTLYQLSQQAPLLRENSMLNGINRWDMLDLYRIEVNGKVKYLLQTLLMGPVLDDGRVISDA